MPSAPARSLARVTRRGRLRRKNGRARSRSRGTGENRANYPYSGLLTETVNASSDIQSVVEGVGREKRDHEDLS